MLTIQNNDESFGFMSFKLNKKCPQDYYLNASLQDERSVNGLSFPVDSRWSFTNGKMSSLDNYRNLAITDRSDIYDFNLSVDIALTGKSSIFDETKQSGIIFGCSNYVSYEDYMDSHSDIYMWGNRFYLVSGYYLAFTSRKIILYKFSVDFTNYEQLFLLQYSFGSRKERNVTISVNDGKIDIFIDKQYVTSYFDPLSYLSGSVGLYASGAEITYSNLRIKAN